MTEIEVRTLIPQSVLDFVLTAQLVIAWAGEGGEEPHLGWWRTDLCSEFGGEDLYRRLLPQTWEWAVLQSIREAARRKDAEIREEAHDADQIVSLFCLGFEIDERVDERLIDLKRAGAPPTEVLLSLRDAISGKWNPVHFVEWLDGHGSVDFTIVPAGRRLKGKLPESLELTVSNLLAGFKPLADTYPLPHFRRST